MHLVESRLPGSAKKITFLFSISETMTAQHKEALKLCMQTMEDILPSLTKDKAIEIRNKVVAEL